MAKVQKGVNDLATTHPELAAQWHPDNNGLRPEDVSAGSNKTVKWLYPYDVPMDYPIEHLRGKHFDFEWDAEIKMRSKSPGCPFLSGRAVWKGFNDLATTHPELAKEWDKRKNKNLTPEMVTAGSNEKVHWRVSQKDLETGIRRRYEWEARIDQRAKQGTRCPQIMSSKGEKLVRNVLELQGITFKEQHVFPDRVGLNDKALLRDDFAIFDRFGGVVGTIEFHGRQHYEPVAFCKEDKEKAQEIFERNQTRDKIKSDYLESHGIKQLVISYKDEDKVQELVNGFIKELSQEYELIKPKRGKEKNMENQKVRDPIAPWCPPNQSGVSKEQVQDFMKMIQGDGKVKTTLNKSSRKSIQQDKGASISF